MFHTKRSLVGAVALAAGAAAVFGLTAGPASATTNYTVTSGGSTNTVTATNSGSLIFEDTYAGAFGTPGNPRMTCTSLSASGTVNPGGHAFTTAPPVTDAAGQITPTAGNLSGCTNTIVGPVTVTPSGTWKLGLSSKTMSGSTVTGGVGYLSGVAVHLHGSVGTNSCDADVTGSLQGTYTNSTGNLVINSAYSGLTFSNVTNTPSTGTLCATVGIYNGDPATGSGTVHLSPAPTIS